MDSSSTPLSLPSIGPTLAALRPGQRYAQPRPPGSGDALLLAALAREARHPLAAFCADPLAARRLADEIALFDPDLRVRFLPDWETLPYDSFSPHQDLISERLRTLHALSQGAVDILVVPVTTALVRLAPPAFLAAYTFHFRQGDALDEERLRTQLTLANYSHVTQVGAPGEFCIRGGLIDLFPMGSALPYRIDLFDREIESIRSFDGDTQRSLYPVREIELLPGREFPMDEAARNRFRARFREVFEGDPSRALPYKDIGNGIAFAGIEYYLPLFFEQTATLFDYLPPDTIAITLGDAPAAIARFSQDARNRWQFLKSDPERPVLPPDTLFLDDEAFHARLRGLARLALTDEGAHPDFAPCPPAAVNRRADDPLADLRRHLAATPLRTALCVDSAGRRETIAELLADYHLKPDAIFDTWQDCVRGDERFSLVVAPLTGGFQAPPAGLAVLTENDLYPAQAGRPARTRRRHEQSSDVDAMVRDLAELHVGDPVVHVQHGIGRYRGLVSMDLGEGPIELLHLEYARDATLYVPVSQLHLIARYSGADPDQAPLHPLGSGQWEKARRKAARQARDTAAELLALYARRAAREGLRFKFPARDYQAFAEGFGFEETPDQAAAITAVIQDMTSGRPMDRLVCGDVGFGKTEVALRAAFLAVMNGRQVALLCPTTLLAEQHAQNFATRFADWPVRIAELSRFRTSKETAKAIAGLAEGSVDIVIGTHKILSKDVRYKHLGLVIIDEEHRFGVRQKEALKALRAEVDVLTLTATPIPRTLGMSLEGIRDFSVIATAPQKRLAIKTFVRPLGSARLGWPCQLMGSGMALPYAFLDRLDLATGHLAEDQKLGADFAVAGKAPQFCPDAEIVSRLPQGETGKRQQRTRWEHGHLAIIGEFCFSLAARAIAQRSLHLLAFMLDLCVPPLTLLAMALLVIAVLGFAWFVGTGATVPLLAAALLLAIFAATIATAWRRFARDVIAWRELAAGPAYCLLKLPSYIRFFIHRRIEWFRTER